MWNDLLLALGLAMIIEGLMPALNPRGWRGLVEQLGELPDGSLRSFGIGLIVVGAVLFHIAR